VRGTMSRLVPSFAAGLLLLGLPAARAQQLPDADPLPRHVPARPASRQDLDRLEALKLYGIGVVQERKNRLIEAMHTFEEALRLDPESAAIYRSLIPLYFALERTDEALAACRRALELDPDDYETGYRYSRQLRARGETTEAMTVLVRTSASPLLKEHLDVRAQVFYDLGVMQEEAGELDKAQKSLREVLAVLDDPTALIEQGPYNRDEVNAQAAETFEHLGRVCLKAKQTERAVEAFRAALKKDSARAARLSYNLAEVYVEQGDPGKALASIEQYLRSQPQGMEGYELRIKLQQELNRQGDVLSSLVRSAAADRNNVALQLLLAREYRKASRLRDAEPIYRRLLETSPTADVYRGLFELFKDQGELGGGRLLSELDAVISKASDDGDEEKNGPPDPRTAEERKEAARRAATHARAMLTVLRDDADLVKLLLSAAAPRLPQRGGMKYLTCLMLAKLAGQTRQFEQAEELYRGCLMMPGRRADNEAEVYAGLLTVLALAHRNEALIELCNEGLKKAKATNRLLFLRELALAHMALGHVREALAAADDAVQTAGTRDSVLRCRLERAGLFSQAEKHEAAVGECQELLKEYNQTGDVRTIRSVLSAVYSAAHQYDKAEEQLLLILKDDPEDATANNDLGYLWADRNKKLGEAEARIRKALELDRRQRAAGKGSGLSLDGDNDNAAYVDSLGWVLFRKGDWSSARRELEKACSLPTGAEDPVVWDHLGDVCFRLKDNARAAEVWHKAIELYESGGRRRPDERYREIKDKLKLLRP
jgi:tetratricopeptide (TPR) repeat protein